MLYSVEGKSMNGVPHKQAFDACCRKMSIQDVDAIMQELDRLFTEAHQSPGNEFLVSSWIPGHDWTGTVFQPIYVASDYDTERAAQNFGLFVWSAAMEHDEKWAFYRCEKLKVPGMTYFKYSK